MTTCSVAMPEIDRLMPIVAETEQIPNRRNSSLNSTAQIADGSERRCFVARGEDWINFIKEVEWF
jgi:hypothetical protein